MSTPTPQHLEDLQELILGSRDLPQAVGHAIGAASMCWSNPSGAGVFQSEEASAITDILLEAIEDREPMVHRVLRNRIEALVRELRGLRGPCRMARCSLYYRHSGPHDSLNPEV